MLILTVHSVVREFRQQNYTVEWTIVNHGKRKSGDTIYLPYLSRTFLWCRSSIPAVFEVFSNMLCITVEPWYSEPLYNEVLGKVNDFLCPSNNEIWKRTWMNESKPRYSEQILPVPWPFVISRFHFSNYDITSFFIIHINTR